MRSGSTGGVPPVSPRQEVVAHELREGLQRAQGAPNGLCVDGRRAARPDRQGVALVGAELQQSGGVGHCDPQQPHVVDAVLLTAVAGGGAVVGVGEGEGVVALEGAHQHPIRVLAARCRGEGEGAGRQRGGLVAGGPPRGQG